MKKFIMAILACLLLSTMVSCGSSVVNKGKIKLAEAAGKGVEKLLATELVKISACDSEDITKESMIIGGKVVEGVKKLLKVKPEGANFSAASSKSVLGSVAQIACKAALTKALPMVVEKNYDEYPCTVKSFGVKMEGVADKVCSKIKL